MIFVDRVGLRGILAVVFWMCITSSVLMAQTGGTVKSESPAGGAVNEIKNSDDVKADYYQGVYKLYGTALRSALHNLIKGHTNVGYDGLYTYFPQTDTKPNGKIWDIYSDIPNGTPKYEYTHGQKKCGSYSGEGDCYNREHSWCDSWLGETNPARSDLFHMYPTDGYVNNRRSNYNFGTVSSPTWTSSNGSKLGPNTFPGYSGTVFEPIDAYKGDLARSAMYMSCRYYTEDGSWSTSPGTNKSDLVQWYANLLYDWHMRDTVSTKEINRNAAIYTIQHNRNPFIDHPEFAAEIWKTDMAPAVVSVTQLGDNSILVDFSRYLDSNATVTVQNFNCDHVLGSPVAVQWGVNNDISKIIVNFTKLATGTTYSLQIKNLKSINSVVMRDTTIAFKTSGPSAVDKDDYSHASRFNLLQNYPNPFNPSTEIKYDLAVSGFVTLKVYDMVGNEAAVLLNNWVDAGMHSVSFNASKLPSGVYYYQMKAGNSIQTKKMLLVK